MTCGIYKITRKDTGQCYIGLSENIEKRYCQHANGNDIKCSRIDRAMVKYGEDKFDLEIIEELPNDRILLMEREEYWVKYYDTYEDKNHYNLTPGGDVCPSKLPEIQAKISEAVSGKNHYMYGKKLPEDTRKKISKALSGENNPMFGKKHSEESIKKMSAAKSGKNHPFFGKFGEEHPAFGRKHTAETKEKISKTCNTSGYYRVHKEKDSTCTQGFIWRYEYCEDGRQKRISSVDIKKLEKKVKAKGLEWIKFDE